MKKRTAKVLVLNCVVQNGGDAAILLSIVGHCRKVFGEKVEILAFDMNATEANILYPDIATFIEEPYKSVTGKSRVNRILTIFRLVASMFVRSTFVGKYVNSFIPTTVNSIQAFVDADIVISTGGTYLVEQYDLRSRMFSFFLARLTGKPTFLYTQSMGPFKKKYIKWFLPIVLKRVNHVFLRDARSQEYLKTIMPNVPSTVCHDVVFDFDHPLRSFNVDEERPLILVSVRAWNKFGNRSEDEGRNIFHQSIADALANLIRKRNVNVLFVSTCQGLENYHFDDSKTAKLVYERLPKECQSAVAINTEFHRPDELVGLLSKSSFVISTRMHMAILSIISKIPVFAIAYEFKTEELFKNLEIGDLQVSIGEIESQSFSSDLLQAFDNRGKIRATLKRALPAAQESAATPLKYLRETATDLGLSHSSSDSNKS